MYVHRVSLPPGFRRCAPRRHNRTAPGTTDPYPVAVPVIGQGLHSLAIGHASQGIDGGTDRGVVLPIDLAQMPQSLGVPLDHGCARGRKGLTMEFNSANCVAQLFYNSFSVLR